MKTIEVLPNIWLGTAKTALDIDFLNRFKIGCIINLTSDVPTAFSHIMYLQIPFKHVDICNRDLNKFYDKVTEFMAKGLKENRAVLVHECYNEKHKSGAVIVAFMMRYLKIEYFDAISYINSKCDIINNKCLGNSLFAYFFHNFHHFQKYYSSDNLLPYLNHLNCWIQTLFYLRILFEY